MTVVAWLASMFWYTTPVSRGLGLLSILAGVERDSLDFLAGATLSGELEKKVRLTIDISDEDGPAPKLVYMIGRERKHCQVLRRRQYH